MPAPPAAAPGDGWHMAQPMGFGALGALPAAGAAAPGGAAMGPLYSAAQAAAEQ
jgi:hypothetical protein